MDKENKDGALQAEDRGPGEAQRDEELFASLRRSKKERKKKRIRRAAIVVGVLAVVLVAAVLILRRQVRENFAMDETEILSAAVERGTISTVVSGSGMLENVDTETVTLPEGVELTEILAQFGESYQEGELLATADMASVRSAMSTLQSELDALDEEISQAEGDTVSSYISAGVAGRVKAIYASEGSGVAEVMVDKGALALISLDGSGRVLCVPVAALDKEGSQDVVYTGCDEDGDRLTAPVAVTTGVSDGEYVQLLSGLEEGQTVYYAWYEAGRETGLPELSPPFGA